MMWFFKPDSSSQTSAVPSAKARVRFVAEPGPRGIDDWTLPPYYIKSIGKSHQNAQQQVVYYK
jgi:hypothetical protein